MKFKTSVPVSQRALKRHREHKCVRQPLYPSHKLYYLLKKVLEMAPLSSVVLADNLETLCSVLFNKAAQIKCLLFRHTLYDSL
jgi:hypothetical protein